MYKKVLVLIENFLAILLYFGLFFIVLSPVSFSASQYDDGDYGVGLYGKESIAPTSTPNSSESSGSSGGGDSSCTNAPPSKAPDLFQIDAKNDTAKLYFAPSGSNISSYYLSFGLGNFDEGFGAPLNIDSRGVGAYDVTYLRPNTTYTFKIRSGNRCATGPWSKSMRIKTANSVKSLIKYYPETQAKTSVIGTLYGLPAYVGSKVAKSPNPQVVQPNTIQPTKKPSSSSIVPSPVKRIEVKKYEPSFFQKIFKFFGL